MKIPTQQSLYIRSMGRALKITAICTNEAEANAYMERNDNDGVVAEIAPFIFMANLYDKGTKMGDEVSA